MTDDDPESRHASKADGGEVRRAGDIIVTAVGGRYAIGRLKADRETQESLGSQEDRAKALQQACSLAGAEHRVFVYLSTGTSVYVRFVCPKVSR